MAARPRTAEGRRPPAAAPPNTPNTERKRIKLVKRRYTSRPTSTSCASLAVGPSAPTARSCARLFAASDAGRAIRWEVDPELWLQRACALAGGGFTPEQWAELVPEQDYVSVCPSG
jgi:hypothetical protein